ncbi:putative membrane protein, partial [Vibrio parahaemolyticus VPCR-2009]
GYFYEPKLLLLMSIFLRCFGTMIIALSKR